MSRRVCRVTTVCFGDGPAVRAAPQTLSGDKENGGNVNMNLSGTAVVPVEYSIRHVGFWVAAG